MTARRGYPAVDRFRVAAALLVVCIHTAPLAFFSAAADFALKTLARLAVPFFFTATGFFLLGELVRPGLRPRTLSPGVRRFLKKTGVLYAACTVLYLPVTLYAGNFPVENVLGELVRDAVLDGTFYHLWYLPAALLGVLVVCGLLRFLRPGAAAGVCGALYLAGLLGDSWYGLAKQLPALKEGYDALFGVMDYTRNGLFFAPAFLMLGALLAGFPARRRPRACLAGLGCSLALLFAEAFGLRALGWPRHDSMYLALVPCACFLFLCLLVPRGGDAPFLREFSMLVYVLHPMAIVGVRGAAIATVISQAASAAFVILFLFGKRVQVPITFGGYDLRVMGRVLVMGFTPFLIVAVDNVMIIAMNAVLQHYGGAARGDALVTCATIAQSFMLVVTMPLGGITGGTQSILSYNYGAYRTERVRQAQKYIFGLGLVFTAVMTLAARLAGPLFVRLFTTDEALAAQAFDTIKVCTLALLPLGLQYEVVDGFTALGLAKLALPLSLWRKAVYFAAVFALPAFFGADAVFYAEPISDVLGPLASVAVYCVCIRGVLARRAALAPQKLPN